ncbi:MAG: VTT domain-containing protein, partial [Planctomycetia bacterium]|nr:VTT domain-containing protein [Planctomycetia bacterium]
MTGEALGWYASIFFWLFLTGIGIPPAPEEAGILYAASVHALHPEVHWSLAWFATGLGIVCADCVLYGVGWKWGPKLFEFRWVQWVLSVERRKRIEHKFNQHGIKLLLLARFLPPLRTGVFLIAGASRYSFVKFLLADVLYAVVGVGLFFF